VTSSLGHGFESHNRILGFILKRSKQVDSMKPQKTAGLL